MLCLYWPYLLSYLYWFLINWFIWKAEQQREGWKERLLIDFSFWPKSRTRISIWVTHEGVEDPSIGTIFRLLPCVWSGRWFAKEHLWPKPALQYRHCLSHSSVTASHESQKLFSEVVRLNSFIFWFLTHTMYLLGNLPTFLNILYRCMQLKIHSNLTQKYSYILFY